MLYFLAQTSDPNNIINDYSMEQILLIGFTTIIFFALAVASVFYIFQSIGMMKMLRSLGGKSPLLAWVPFARTYALGYIADQYDNGNTPKKHGIAHTILMTVNLASWVLVLYYLINSVIIAYGDMTYEEYLNSQSIEMTDEVLASFSLFSLFLMLGLGLCVAYLIYHYIVLYKVYRIFAPDNASVLLIFSIIFAISKPFIICALQNKAPRNLRVTCPAYNGQNGVAYPFGANPYQPYGTYPQGGMNPPYGMPPQGGAVPPQYGMPPQGGAVPPQYGMPPQGGAVPPQYGMPPQGGAVPPQYGMPPQGGAVPPQYGMPPQGNPVPPQNATGEETSSEGSESTSEDNNK